MVDTRRRFLKFLGLGSAGVAIGPLKGTERKIEASESDADWLLWNQCRFCGDYQLIELVGFEGRQMIHEQHNPKCRRADRNGVTCEVSIRHSVIVP